MRALVNSRIIAHLCVTKNFFWMGNWIIDINFVSFPISEFNWFIFQAVFHFLRPLWTLNWLQTASFLSSWWVFWIHTRDVLVRANLKVHNVCSLCCKDYAVTSQPLQKSKFKCLWLSDLKILLYILCIRIHKFPRT